MNDARLPTTGQPLDILSLGCSTISKGRDQPGRIITIDVEMTNLQPKVPSCNIWYINLLAKIEGKIRLVEKILRICSTFLRQDPEGVAGQVFDICANAVTEIYQSNSHLIQTLQPFYWREVFSTIKYSVDENKELGAGMRLSLCNIIADLEGKTRTHTDYSADTRIRDGAKLKDEVTRRERLDPIPTRGDAQRARAIRTDAKDCIAVATRPNQCCRQCADGSIAWTTAAPFVHRGRAHKALWSVVQRSFSRLIGLHTWRINSVFKASHVVCSIYITNSHQLWFIYYF